MFFGGAPRGQVLDLDLACPSMSANQHPSSRGRGGNGAGILLSIGMLLVGVMLLAGNRPEPPVTMQDRYERAKEALGDQYPLELDPLKRRYVRVPDLECPVIAGDDSLTAGSFLSEIDVEALSMPEDRSLLIQIDEMAELRLDGILQDNGISTGVFVDDEGLVLGLITVADNDERGWRVSRTQDCLTDPPPTTTTTVPPDAVPLPDVTSTEYNEAILILFDYDVRVERVEAADDDVAEGFVIATDPAPGEPVWPLRVVTVTVSSGNPTATVLPEEK